MKKLLLFITLFITPVMVYASETLSIDTKTYNKDTKVLKVSGLGEKTASGQKPEYKEIQVSIFNGNKLLAMKTDSLDSHEKFETEFKIALAEETTLTIKVADQDGYETQTTTIVIPKAELPNVISDSNNNSITDNNEGTFNSNYTFEIEDLLEDLTDDMKTTLKSQLKSNETFITALNITVKNGSDEVRLENGSYTVRFKLTDEMKKYDSLKLVYVTVDENGVITLHDTIDVTIDGDYGVFRTTHLSYYSVIGVKNPITKTQSNPKTYDGGVLTYVLVGTLSVAVIAGSVIYLKKNKTKLGK